MVERTLILVKPDGVQRGLIGEVISRFERRGLKLVGMKFMQATEAILEKHYVAHIKKPFYPGLVTYLMSGPIVAMVWEGLDAIKVCRLTIGDTHANEAPAGTIRGDLAIHISRNIVHGSADADDAAREVPIWFSDAELISYERATDQWICRPD